MVTVPTACKYDYDYMQWQFPHEKAVDVALYASQWVANIAIEKSKGKNLHKINVWPSGVELSNEQLFKEITNSCVIYFKKQSVNNELLNILEELNINYNIIEYGKYDFKQYVEALKKSDFVIFYQDCQETQGLAMAEAWSYNLPTFIKTKVKDSLKGTAPYLCSQNGEYFSNLEELKKLLLNYKDNPEKFLSKFSPRKYIIENMSDTKSVERLLRIFSGIKK